MARRKNPLAGLDTTTLLLVAAASAGVFMLIMRSKTAAPPIAFGQNTGGGTPYLPPSPPSQPPPPAPSAPPAKSAPPPKSAPPAKSAPPPKSEQHKALDWFAGLVATESGYWGDKPPLALYPSVDATNYESAADTAIRTMAAAIVLADMNDKMDTSSAKAVRVLVPNKNTPSAYRFTSDYISSTARAKGVEAIRDMFARGLKPTQADSLVLYDGARSVMGLPTIKRAHRGWDF